MLIRFYLYGRPESPPTQTQLIEAVELPCWDESCKPPPLQGNLEATQVCWNALKGLHFEPDGSFVWSGGQTTRWELCGTFYEQQDSLWYAEIQGSCEPEHWPVFLSTISGGTRDHLRFSALLLLPKKRLIPAELLPKIWFHTS